MKVIIYTDNITNEFHMVSPAEGLDIDLVAKVSIPEGQAYEIVNESDLPSDRTFRGAWKHDTSTKARKAYIDIKVARELAHDHRRAAREVLFAPLDKDSLIPMKAVAAEAARAEIREADAIIQKNIDSANTVGHLRKALANGI